MASKIQVRVNVQFSVLLIMCFLPSSFPTPTNMNGPIFQENSYDLDISEDFPVGAPLLTVNATDGDAGDKGRVEYTFEPTTSSWYLNQFQLDTDTGELSLKQHLDYESVAEYNLVIVASDKAPNSKSSTANLVIRIVDMNDNSPEISINTLTGNLEAEISENLPASSFVAHVSVFDNDSGENGKVTCTLDHTDFAMLSIHQNEYQIVTRSSLDREVVNRYSLEVDCQDQGDPSLSRSETFTVNVLDENDNSPVFQQNKYDAVLSENNVIDAHIITVHASDRDAGPNADLRYYMTEPKFADQYVRIHEHSGEIRAHTVFDYEHIHQFEFIVIASDQGMPQRSTTTSVQITIMDTNDEAPQFNQAQYTFGIFENNPIDEMVGSVRAVDQDSSPKNAFVYSMAMAQHAEQGTFHIDESSGQITTLKTLDRERQNVYHMTVFATDNANPSLVGSADVTIYVADLNDNYPMITSPDRHSNMFPVSNHAPVGYIITRVSAIDYDIGANALLIFSVSSDDGRGLFAIDALTGELSVAKNIRDLDYEMYRIQIHVSDSGEPARNATIDVSIVGVEDQLGTGVSLTTCTQLAIYLKLVALFSNSLVLL